MSESSALRSYFILRGALLRHQQLPWRLSADEQQALAQATAQEERLVSHALDSPGANEVAVEEAALHQALTSFQSSLASLGDVAQLLNQAGLQQTSLAAAIDAELRAAAVLERLTAAVLPTEQEVRQWYAEHPEQFVVPERREVYQILITVNELYPENRREVVCRRMDELFLEAKRAPERFGQLALSHSECPSAVEAGRLGVVPPGHLYPELDRLLFSLESGAVSPVVESPLGFHLLRCGQIEPTRRLAWDEVKETLTRRLTERKRKNFLQRWLGTR